MDDLISRQDAIDALNDGAELLRRFLDETYVVGDERAKYEWGLGLIESYIYDMDELPSAQPEIKPIEYRDCASAMLRMWMDGVVTDREYNRIMDKLNAYWRAKNGQCKY